MATTSSFKNMLNGTKSVSKTPLKETKQVPKKGEKSSYKGMCGGK